MIKILTACTLVLLLGNSAFSQANFKVKWESTFENDADYWRYTTDDGKYIVGTTKKDVNVIDGATGKSIWTKTFSEIAGVKEAKTQQVIEGTATLMFISQQKGNDELFSVDLKTGKKLWSNDQFNGISLGNLIYISEASCFAVIQKKGLTFIDENTGQEKGSVEGISGVIGRYAYTAKTNELLLFAYQVNSLKAIGSGFKNHLVCVNMSSFKQKWNTVIKGVVEVKRQAGKSFSIFDWATVGINRGIGSSNVLVDLLVRDNKAYVIMNGLEAFDLNTGTKIWSIDYDLSLDRGLGGASQLYNAVADPLFTSTDIYITSFGKGRNKSLQKYDIETGKMLWETELDGRKVIIPTLSLVNGLVVAQIGGFVNIQGEDGGGSFSKWKWQGPFGLKAFDAATGKLKWQTEKFDSRITNTLVKNNALYVADENSLYGINTNTGDKDFETKLKDAKAGKAQYIFGSNENIIVLGEDGLAAFDSKGKSNYSLKAKDALMNFSDAYGEALYYIGTEEEVIAVNLVSGKEIGRFNYKKGYTYGIKNLGNTFVVYKDNKVTTYDIR